MEAVIPASLYVRELQMFKPNVKEKSYKSKINLSQECKTEISSRWIQQLQVWNWKQVITNEPVLVIETDVSKMGWGFHCRFSQTIMGRSMEPSREKTSHEFMRTEISNPKQTKCTYSFDNITAVTNVNKMGEQNHAF